MISVVSNHINALINVDNIKRQMFCMGISCN